MAPKVCVPADFGRHHIGAPSHGNLTFNLQQGLQIKANSIILSLNSPIIDNLTTDLHLTSLEAEDFSREAVDCFIEASYTGEVEALNVGNFREVNKMGYAFKVDWLVAKCEQYFLSYLEKLNSESSYSDVLFAVQEAVYVLSTLKTKDLLHLVARKINLVFSTEMRSSFITDYLVDLGICSKAKIDTCITIVKQDLIHVLIKILLEHMEKLGHKNLDENSRHLLRNVDLTVCLGKHPDIHAQLFTTLENIEHVEKEDYQLFVSLHKQTTGQSHAQSSSVELDLFPFPKDFISYTDFEFVLYKLASDPRVDSLYSLFDGLWCRLFQEDFFGGSCKVPDDIAEKIVAIKDEHCWGRMNYNYVDRIDSANSDHLMPLIDNVRNCINGLVSKQPRTIVFCDYITAGDFVEKYFRHNSSYEFKISGAKYEDMNFVFSTTAMIGDDPDTFSMKFVLIENRQKKKMKLERHDTNRHGYHQMPKLHFALEVIAADENTDESTFLPISWCSKPICDKTKTFWKWGYVTFHGKECEKLDMVLSKDGCVEFNENLSTYSLTDGSEKVRLVAYLIE